MELIESIRSINEKLKQEYGSFSDGRPNFRVVFSEDEYEKRWTNFTQEGFELLNKEVRLLPKYKQWLKQKYVLERLVPVGPDSDLTEKTSYEPSYVFQDKHMNYLIPRFDVCSFVIESIYAAMSKAGTHARYRDVNETPEVREKRLDDMKEKLFGNDTDVSHALAYGSGVGFTTSKTLTDDKIIADNPSKLVN